MALDVGHTFVQAETCKSFGSWFVSVTLFRCSGPPAADQLAANVQLQWRRSPTTKNVNKILNNLQQPSSARSLQTRTSKISNHRQSTDLHDHRASLSITVTHTHTHTPCMAICKGKVPLHEVKQPGQTLRREKASLNESIHSCTG